MRFIQQNYKFVYHTVSFKIVNLWFKSSVPRVHGHKRLDDDATGWSTGQTAPTHPSDVFWVHQHSSV